MIALIAAVAKNNVIGKGNDLPWYIPEDLKHFQKLTTEKTVLMGRKTFESIFNRLGKPLPHRKNVVVTHDAHYTPPPTVVVYHSIEEALQALGREDIMVIGGGELYRQTIDQADTLYITHVHKEIEGDTFFPPIDPQRWREISREDRKEFSWVTYTNQQYAR